MQQAIGTQPTMAEVMAQLQALKAENERLKASKATSGSIKVSGKGAVSVYGLGRFPVTLYKSQWEKLFARQSEVSDFITQNESLLAVKE